jgi:hypothetical protein
LALISVYGHWAVPTQDYYLDVYATRSGQRLLREVLGGVNDDAPGIGKALRARVDTANRFLEALGFVTVPAQGRKTAKPTPSGHWGLARGLTVIAGRRTPTGSGSRSVC